MDFLPVVVFSLLFLAILVVSLLFAVRPTGSRSRWWGLLFAVFGLAGLLLTIIPRPSHSEASPLIGISGTYVGDYSGGTNTFLLHPDGTFDQCFVDDTGREYRNRGTWGIAGDVLGLCSSVYFKHMLDTLDGFGRPRKPEMTDYGSAALELDGSINFNEDAEIALGRVSGDDRRWPWEAGDGPSAGTGGR